MGRVKLIRNGADDQPETQGMGVFWFCGTGLLGSVGLFFAGPVAGVSRRFEEII
jgi:hypothetical protein